MNIVPIRRVRPGVRANRDTVDFGADTLVVQHLPPFERRGRLPPGSQALHGIAVEVRTARAPTGDELLVELALCRFTADGEGRIVEAGRPQFHVEDTGLGGGNADRAMGFSSARLGGRRIRDGEASCALMSADVIVAVDTDFIRPLLERRLPEIADGRWVSVSLTMEELPLGHKDGGMFRLMAALCGRNGNGRVAHRLNALLHLLDHRLPDGRFAIAALLGMSPSSTGVDPGTTANR